MKSNTVNQKVSFKTEKELQEAILKEKAKGTSDLEIGQKYGVTFRYIEKLITRTQGLNISALRISKKIKKLYPKDFKEEQTTVWSFKQRGKWATHSGEYRGNWSPYIPRNVILKYSKPNELVLDYFCGAGTTAVECKLLGRRCIAFDINDKAIELARKNLDFTFESPTGTQLAVSNGDMESWPSGVSSIEKAYTISNNEMDVIYDYAVSSVDPTDYTLTGTATITFTGATIDGSDPKIVHLTGASSNMNGDATLDNIADAALSLNFDFYAGIMPISYTNTNNPGGTLTNGYIATYQGIISANDAANILRKIAISDSKLSYQSISVIGVQKNLRPTALAFPINARHWESLPFYSRHRCFDGKHKELG